MGENKVEDRLINTRDLAALLGVSVRSIEGWRRDDPHRLPPHIVLGARAIRYRLPVVRAWLQGLQDETQRTIFRKWGHDE